MGPEATLQAKCRKFAKANGWWCAKFTSPGTSSVPDYIFAKSMNGVDLVLFVEFKAPGKKPTALQEHTHREMIEHGMRVFVVDNFETFRVLIDG